MDFCRIDIDPKGGKFQVLPECLPYMTIGAMQDDAAIMREILSVNKEQFAILIERYQSHILRLTTALLRDSDLADDASQEIFLKTYRSLSKFRGDSSFKTWISRIATHHCIDIIRTKKREGADSLEQLMEKGVEKFHSIFQEPADLVALAEQRELLDQLLNALPADYRIALLLREVEDYSYEEIAEITGWSVESVRGRLRRGRDLLEKKLRHF